jgi:sec-independent protein translocase protein TatA
MGIFGNAFGWPHLIIILAVILLIFGATRLPALAKSVAQSTKIFRNELKSDDKSDADSTDGTVKSEAAPQPDETAKK